MSDEPWIGDQYATGNTTLAPTPSASMTATPPVDIYGDSITGTNIPFLNNFYIRTLDLENADKKNFYIPFQTMPEKIIDSKNANYEDTFFIAGSSPLKTYTNSTARVISFTLDFFHDIEKQNILKDLNGDSLKQTVDNARSLLYPDYKSKQISPPTKCLVRLGGQVSMIGICKSVNVLYDSNKPWQLGQLALPHGVSISFVFEEITTIPSSYQDIQADTLSNYFAKDDPGYNWRSAAVNSPLTQPPTFSKNYTYTDTGTVSQFVGPPAPGPTFFDIVTNIFTGK